MTNLPIQAMTAAQQKLFRQAYALLGKQVKSYHKHYHMGDNSSIPVETAQALLASIWYTLEKAGGDQSLEDPEWMLAKGQAVLNAQMAQAKSLLQLVSATSPKVQNECYQDTLLELGRFLRQYDPLHLAHTVPELLPYPLLAPLKEGLQGIDFMLTYLEALWRENQILAALEPEAVEAVIERIGPDAWGIPINLCEQPLVNALGRALLGKPVAPLLLEYPDQKRLAEELNDCAGGALMKRLAKAMAQVCVELELQDPKAVSYAHEVISQVQPRLEAALPSGNLEMVFLA